mgnify:CR=1 FL=1
MAIKLKHRNPKSTDFKRDDIVINIKEGSLFFKSNKGLHKVSTETFIDTDDISKNTITINKEIPEKEYPNYKKAPESNSITIGLSKSQGLWGSDSSYFNHKNLKIENNIGYLSLGPLGYIGNSMYHVVRFDTNLDTFSFSKEISVNKEQVKLYVKMI